MEQRGEKTAEEEETWAREEKPFIPKEYVDRFVWRLIRDRAACR